ncbi:uncharacterized protein B0H18DRAFT_479156 [Fomitopsis serialis]|uniref:uncharacterized protein n=1 Tax=Fomitopsis serialis TaxID=139415 RepID=UPI002008A437|nr:uncharacterized protein B0H18DRAFT_479156 [Neoantrodia serialis]KAH9923057.1 hypothetical protein B0H18DRAFT_479156 [Neoantrodia serialis]
MHRGSSTRLQRQDTAHRPVSTSRDRPYNRRHPTWLSATTAFTHRVRPSPLAGASTSAITTQPIHPPRPNANQTGTNRDREKRRRTHKLGTGGRRRGRWHAVHDGGEDALRVRSAQAGGWGASGRTHLGIARCAAQNEPGSPPLPSPRSWSAGAGFAVGAGAAATRAAAHARRRRAARMAGGSVRVW